MSLAILIYKIVLSIAFLILLLLKKRPKMLASKPLHLLLAVDLYSPIAQLATNKTLHH